MSERDRSVGRCSDNGTRRKLSGTQMAYLNGRNEGQAFGGVDCLALFEFHGTGVDIEALGNAIRNLRRHPVLRSVMLEEYHWENSSVETPFTLSVLEHSGTKRQLEEYCSHQRRTILARQADYAAGEMGWVDITRWQHTDMDRTISIVHITISLAAADLAAVGVIINEMAESYLASSRGLETSPALQVRTFSEIEAQEKKFAEEMAAKKKRSKISVGDDVLPAGPQIPLQGQPGRSVTRRSASLSSRQWQALGSLARRAGTSRSALSLAIYHHALSLWADETPFTIVVPGLDARATPNDVLDRTRAWAVRPPTARGKSIGDAARAATSELRARVDRGLDSSQELGQALRFGNGHPGNLPFVLTPGAELKLLTPTVIEAFGCLKETGSITPQVLVDLQILRFFDDEVTIALDIRDGAYPQIFGDELFETLVDAHRRIADAELGWKSSEDGALSPLGGATRHAPEEMNIAEVVCLAESTRRRRHLLNDTPRFSPRTLHASFLTHVEETPDAVAVIDHQAGDLTYRELYNAALRLAETLEARVNPSDLVALRLPKGREQVVAVLAVLLLGGAYLPVDVDAPEERIDAIFSASNPACVIDSIPSHVFKESEESLPRIEPREVSPGDIAYVIFTSGSTGTPKGVVMTHEAAANTIDAVCARSHLSARDSVLAVSALDFDLSVFDIFGLLSVGGKIVCISEDERRDAFAWAELIQTHSITVWNSAPALAEMLIVAAAGEEALSLRHVFVSGDWVPKSLPEKTRRVSPNARVVSMGGATEAGIWSNEYVLTGAGDLPVSWASIPYGVPLDGQAYRVVNEWGEDCPTGVVGELWIGGTSLAQEYLGQNDLTMEKFVNPDPAEIENRWYRTGDHGYWHVAEELDGAPDLLFFVGRKDNQVKIRGHRVELGDVEHHLCEIPEVAATVVVPNREKNSLIALVVPEKGLADAGQEFSARIAETLRSRLPRFMIPSTLVIVPKLELTANGKVDRAWATQRANSEISTRGKENLQSTNADAEISSGVVLPQSDARYVVTVTWATALEGVEVEQLDETANFFALGGDSIAATSVCADLRSKGFEVQVIDLFTNPRLGAFAEVCREHKIVGNPTIPTYPVEECLSGRRSFPLTPLQRAYALGNDGLAGTVHAHTVFSAVMENKSSEGFCKSELEKVLCSLFELIAPLRIIRENEPVSAQRLLSIDEIVSRGGGAVKLLEDREATGETLLREVLSTRVPQLPLEFILPYEGANQFGVLVDYLALDGRSLATIMAALRGLLATSQTSELQLPPWLDGSAEEFIAYCHRSAELEEQGLAAPKTVIQSAAPPELPIVGMVEQASEFFSIRATVPRARLDQRAQEESASCGLEITPSAIILAEYGATLARLSKQASTGIVVPLSFRPDLMTSQAPTVGAAEILGTFSQLGVCDCSAEPNPAEIQRSLISQLGSTTELSAVSDGRSGRFPAVFTSTLGYDFLHHSQDKGQSEAEVHMTWVLTRTPGILIDCQVSNVFAQDPAKGQQIEIRWDMPRNVLDSGQVAGAFAEMIIALGGEMESTIDSEILCTHHVECAGDKPHSVGEVVEQTTALGLLSRVLEILDTSVASQEASLVPWARPVVDVWRRIVYKDHHGLQGKPASYSDAPLSWLESDARHLVDIVRGRALRFSLLEHPRLSPRALIAQDPRVYTASQVLHQRLMNFHLKGMTPKVIELGFGLPPGTCGNVERSSIWTVVEPDTYLNDVATVAGRSCVNNAADVQESESLAAPADFIVLWGSLHRDPRIAMELADLPLAPGAELHIVEPIAHSLATLTSAALLNPALLEETDVLWAPADVEHLLSTTGWWPRYFDADDEKSLVIRAIRSREISRSSRALHTVSTLGSEHPSDGRTSFPVTDIALVHQLSQCWADNLPQLDQSAWKTSEELDAATNFFEAGGDSLAATHVLSSMQRHGFRGLRVVDLFNHPTFGDFAAYVRNSQVSNPESRQLPRFAKTATDDSSDGAMDLFPLTRVQRAYLAGIDPEQLLGGLPARCSFEYSAEKIEPARLEKAVKSLVDVHPVLRSVTAGPSLAKTKTCDELLPAFRYSSNPSHDLEQHVPDHRNEGPLVVWASDKSVAVSMNNLFIDGASMVHIMTQLSQLYADPKSKVNVPEVTPQRYLATHPELTSEGIPDRLIPALDAELETLPNPPLLPDGRTLVELDSPRMERLIADVDIEVWERARATFARWHVTPAAGVLAAFGRALAEYDGTTELTVNLTRFDRDLSVPGVKDVVGDFTRLSVVPLRRLLDDDLRNTVCGVQKELLRADAPERDALYVATRAVQRHGDPTAGLFPVVFTCGLGLNRGQDQQPLELRAHSFGAEVKAQSTTPQVVLDLQVIDDAEGLHLTADWLVQALPREDVRWILDALVAQLYDYGRNLIVPDTVDAERVETVTTGVKCSDRKDIEVIWAEVLGLTQVTEETNFFHSGGDSLKATKLIGQIRAHGHETSLRTLLAHPDFGAFCSAILGSNTERQAPRGREGVLTPQTQESLADEWFDLTDVQASYLLGRADAFDDGGVACQGYSEFRIDSSGLPADQARDLPGALTRAWKQVVARHDMVRAVIDREGKQRIDWSAEVPLRVVPLPRENTGVKRVREEIRQELCSKNYEIGTAPMMDIVLSVGHEDAVVHLSVDLIITDYVGIRTLVAELDWYLSHPNESLPAPVRSFRQCLEQRWEELNTPTGRALVEADRSWWREKMTTAPAALVFSREDSAELRTVDTNTTSSIGTGTTRRSFIMDDSQWTAICSSAGAQGITPSALVLGIFATVARRYAELPPMDESAVEEAADRSALITLTTVDRPQGVADLSNVVGDFTSTALLDLPLMRDPLHAAREVQDRLFAALDHSSYSGVQVARDTRRVQGADRGSIPVVFTSTVGVEAQRPPRHLIPIPESSISKTPQVLLDVQLTPIGDGVSVDWDSRDGGFHPDVLDACFADFTALLRQFIGGLPANLPPRLPEPVIRTDEDTSGRECRHRDLHGAFLRAALEDPDAVAVIAEDEIVSRGQFAELVWRVARSLPQGRSPVMIDLAPGVEQVAVQFAALLAGRPFVPLDIHWPEERKEAIRQSLVDAGNASVGTSAKIEGKPVIITQRTIAGLQEVTGNEADWKRAFAAVCERLEQHTELRDSVAYIIFTSGSTGAPKGVAVTHRQVATTLEDIDRRLHLGPKDRVLAVSRPSFDLAIFNAFGVLGAGGALVVPSCGTTPDPETWVADLHRHHVTLWNSVPAQLTIMLDYLDGILSEDELPLRIVLVSGDLVPPEQPEYLRRYAPKARFLALGGATEGSIWSIVHECRLQSTASLRLPIPYGRALANQGMWVLNSDGERAAPGQLGEIVIAGDGVAEGYLQDSESPTSAFSVHATGERIYRTGDRGKYLSNGEIAFCGRLCDSQVKVRGYRIELGEVEAALRNVSGVKDALATVVGEGNHRELVAVITPRNRYRSEELGDMDQVSFGSAQDLLESEDAAHAALRKRGMDAHTNYQFAAQPLRELHSLITRISRQEMWATLRRAEEALKRRGATVTFRSLVSELGAEGRSHLLSRWIAELNTSGYLTVTSDVQQITPNTALKVLSSSEVSAGIVSAETIWARVFDLNQQCDYGTRQLKYLKSCLDQLPELLDGRKDPLSLLFPEGDMTVARASYGRNLLSSYLNTICAEMIDLHAETLNSYGQSCRILEIGGGVGATTEPVLEKLDRTGRCYEYLFSDISRYFTEAARQEWPQVSSQHFDINVEPGEQGIPEGSRDVVLCANVLHNAKNIDDALRTLHAILAPGGIAVIIDSTATNAPLMASMEFKEGLGDANDVRQNSGSPFLDFSQWQAAVKTSPMKMASVLPPKDSALELGAQHVFVLRKPFIHRTLSESLETATVKDDVMRILPAYMIPSRLVAVDSLPMTHNGKRDRGQVEALVDAAGSDFAEPKTSADIFEKPDETSWAVDRAEKSSSAEGGNTDPIRLAWREVLGLDESDALTNESNFFDLGGDSLLLARCIGQMRRSVNSEALPSWDETLRAIVAEPTIDGCYRALNLETPRVEASIPQSEANLVAHSVDTQRARVCEVTPPRIRCLAPAGESGTESAGAVTETLVLIHDGSGSVSPYEYLIEEMTASEAYKGKILAVERSSGDNYLDTSFDVLFHELIERYAHELLTRVGQRAHIVGYCMGGLLAAGIGDRLAACGVETRVTVLSSYRIPFEVTDDLLLDFSFAKLMNCDPADMGIAIDEDALGLALRCARAAGHRRVTREVLRENASPELLEQLRQCIATTEERLSSFMSTPAGQHWTRDSLLALRAVYVHSLAAVAHFSEPPVVVPVTFLRQSGSLSFLPDLGEDMTDFWEEHCLSDLEILDIPGDHFTCLNRENAANVAAVLLQRKGGQ